MVLIWLIKVAFYKNVFFFVIYKNGWEHSFNLLSKKQRFDTKDNYKNNKERLREQARDKYKSLSEEGKNKKREYEKNRYHSMCEE